jgi:hypothetical protein
MPQCQFMFSAIFVFQKSYTGNILGIGWNKSWSSYLPEGKTESKGETKLDQEAAAPWGCAGHPLAVPLGGVGPWSALWHPSMKSSAAPPPLKTNFGGQKSLFRHPAGTGNCPRSHLHRLHRHLHRCCWLPWWGGSSSAPRLRALPVAMCSSLSPMVWSLCDHELCI